MTLNFLKMHGLGNDFVLVDGLADPAAAEVAAASAESLCDRHFGVGADGVVLLLAGSQAALRMRIFNPDGSEAEMCGNAMRCLARYAYERGLTKETTFAVETLSGPVYPTVNLLNGKVGSVSVDMGAPRFQADEIPMRWPTSPVVEQPLRVGDGTLLVTCLSMGNPHCVIFVDDVAGVPVRKLGPQIEHEPAFRNRVNVEFAQVTSRTTIRVRVWERGAGETLACGTGACAAAVASVVTKRADRKVTVSLNGGDLAIEWRADDHVLMTGAADYVFEGRVFP